MPIRRGGLKQFALLVGVLSLTMVAQILACGGSTTEPASAGGGGAADSGAGGAGIDGSAGSGGTTGGSAGAGGASPGNCPPAPPEDGSFCTPPWSPAGVDSAQVHCSWGDDPRPDCRTIARCATAAWEVTAPDTQECSPPPLPPSCENPLPADGSVCPDASLTCWYENGARCWCSSCLGGSGYPTCQVIDPPQWHCATPAAGCPATAPQAGAPCAVEGASCGPDCTLQILCSGGVWQWLPGNCPVCAAPDTPVATPTGDRPIAALRPGDLVYSVDHGAVVVVPVARIGRTDVTSHQVVRVVLASGVVLHLSPGHPTADGRIFADLVASSLLDESNMVVSARLVPYVHDATYDVLPASGTGTYFAGGALVGSTLFEPERRPPAP